MDAETVQDRAGLKDASADIRIPYVDNEKHGWIIPRRRQGRQDPTRTRKAQDERP
jgi:hypothetical protein